MRSPLDPNQREVLTDGLEPDPEFVLDCAVVTTFSVDLEALLLAPLAFARFDTDNATDGLEPTALFSSLRSYADRISIYCDAAHVSSSATDGRLFSMLERTLHPILIAGGAFHPKVWVLRFRRGDETLHRILVLTRNHTFDRSWDLVVRIDESTDETGVGAPVGRQVASFLDYLNQESSSPITADLAKSIRRARFAPPNGFDDVAFHGMWDGQPDPLDVTAGKRLLITSPFLHPSRIKQLADLATGRSPNRYLISSPHELQRLGAKALEPYDETLCLHSEAADANEIDTDNDATYNSGLHAKLYVRDENDNTHSTWYIGSANATKASTEKNVEALLELRGKTTTIGVRQLMREPNKNEVNLRSLLRRFEPENDEEVEEDPKAKDEKRIDNIVKELLHAGPVVDVSPVEDRFELELSFSDKDQVSSSLPTDSIYVRLASGTGASKRRVGRQPVDLSKEICAVLKTDSASRVTGLIEFTIESGAPAPQRSAPRRFIALAQLLNAPEDRDEQLLLELIPNAARFRLLLFLLLASGDPEGTFSQQARALISFAASDQEEASEQFEIPLFESLARAYAREPERLKDVAEVVATLRKTEKGRDRLPEGFDELWDAFAQSKAVT